MNKDEILYYLTEDDKTLFDKARKIRDKAYGKKVFLRGLIEFTNYCKNDCYYCGIRKSNHNVKRYHLSLEEILKTADLGYEYGLKTFVLQGGEDLSFEDKTIVKIVNQIKNKYPDVAITLSIGERSKESYKMFKEAGADRYLLRHETANEIHYNKLHPKNMSLKSRKECLYSLKEIGFQVGAGFMVGSPYQTDEMILEDLLFLKELEPQMVGIGPFIPHKDTPFKNFDSGNVEKTLKCIAITRLILNQALIPSTTALASLGQKGRLRGLDSGANVVMPNITPIKYREDYALYNNKISMGKETLEGIKLLIDEIEHYGYIASLEKGDFLQADN